MKLKQRIIAGLLLVPVLSLLFSSFFTFAYTLPVNAATDSHGCNTSTQYYQSPTLGTPQGQCVNKKDNPRNQSDCPKGYTFVNTLGGTTCQVNGASACTSSQYWQGPSLGTPTGQCIDKQSQPRNQSDCPKGYTFVKGLGGNVCQVNGASACTSSQYWQGPSLGTPTGQCIDKQSQPRNQSDCPKGTTYTNSGTGGTCQANPASTNSSSNTGSDNKQLDCAVTNALNWIICPVVGIMTSFIDAIDNMITNELTVGSTDGASSDQPNQIFCDKGNSTCQSYHTAWASFRNIALGLMAVAGLIILISQALGFELLDAYTIKKALPRLLIAAIGITLSWPLMQFFVTLSNDLGFGVRHLIYAPFSGISDKIHLSLGGTAATTLLAGAGFFAIGAFGLLTYAGTAALTVLIAIVVLILRQVAIIMLIILAPIAIVAYILPNTQNLYKLWWDSFSKALMMFPIIAGFIAAGRVFSAIAMSNGSDFYQLIGFVSYFAPYLLIPATFKLAGGAIRQIGGFVNDRSKGGFDKLRNARQNNTKNRVQRARAGKLYREGWGTFGFRGKQRSISGIANRAALWALDSDELIPGRIGEKGGPLGRALFGNYAAQAKDKIANETMEHVNKAAQAIEQKGPLHHKAARAFAGVWGDVDENGNGIDGGYSAYTQSALRAAGFVDGVAPETAAQMHRFAQVLRETGGTDEVSAADDIENASGFMANLNKDHEMFRAGGNIQAVGAMVLAGQGRLSSKDQARLLNQVSRNSREGNSLAARLEKQTSSVGSRQRTELRHGKGLYQDAVGEWHSSFGDKDGDLDNPVVWAKAKDNLLTAKAGELAASKGETVDQYTPVWKKLLAHKEGGTAESPQWSNEQETARQQLFYLASRYSQSDPDAKAKALKVIDDLDMRSEFNINERAFDEEQRRGTGGGDSAAAADASAH